MVWTKLSDDFGVDVANAGLSDQAFRTHVEGLLWTMGRLTDGRISPRDLRRLAEVADPQRAAAELVAAGFWKQVLDGEGWLIVHHMAEQPESDVVYRRRRKNAERQQKSRRKKAGLSTEVGEPQDSLPADRHGVTAPMTPNVTTRVTRDGAGRDGAGKPAPTGERCAWCKDPLDEDSSDGMHDECADKNARDFAQEQEAEAADDAWISEW